ncbi:Isochorismatase-like protein [Podospora aff. communis PSN243]|uniref:Isochorismatase-like protein n=1 Tax=Podospora aff. communis PSN243 TaxID=3040156 RepID=A0AAV9G3P4_9PEZI|nr:Isochorismatase-like protein [Podospora aff. communis PSN243]
MTNPTALFVIDIQNDNATDPATRVRTADRVKDAGNRILRSARLALDTYRDTKTTALPILIIFVQHEDLPGKGTLLRDTEAWKLVFEPRPGVEEEILVQKTTRNTFETNPELADMLKSQGVSEIVAFGIQSECCVESTCRGAREEGFDVTLLSGAHSTYDVEGKSAEDIEVEVESRLREVGVKIEAWEDTVARGF